MVSVNKSGQMEQSMRGNGKIIRQKEKENLFILMAIITKANGETIRQTAMVFLYTLKLERDMKDIGKMICNMDQVWSFTAMAINTKECLSKAGEMVKAFIRIQLVKSIQEGGLTVVLRDSGPVYGQMGKSMRGNGKIIKSTEVEFLHGLMEELMKEIIAMIRNMVMELIHGQMGGSILGNGRMINDMEGALM